MPHTTANAEVSHPHLDRLCGEVPEILPGAGVGVEVTVFLVEVIARERLEGRVLLCGAVALHGRADAMYADQHFFFFTCWGR